MPLRFGHRVRQFEDWVYAKMQEVKAQQIVFFTRGDGIANLNRVMQYIENNEHTDRVKVVTVVAAGDSEPPELAKQLNFLDQAYPDIDIELVVMPGEFSPALIQRLSDEWSIPKNLMFVGSPGDHFSYGISELGGVRLII